MPHLVVQVTTKSLVVSVYILYLFKTWFTARYTCASLCNDINLAYSDTLHQLCCTVAPEVTNVQHLLKRRRVWTDNMAAPLITTDPTECDMWPLRYPLAQSR